MSTPFSVVPNTLARAQQILDDALAERDRINRRIRRIRGLVKAAEAGDDVPELDAMLDAITQPAAPSPAPARPRRVRRPAACPRPDPASPMAPPSGCRRSRVRRRR